MFASGSATFTSTHFAVPKHFTVSNLVSTPEGPIGIDVLINAHCTIRIHHDRLAALDSIMARSPRQLLQRRADMNHRAHFVGNSCQIS